MNGDTPVGMTCGTNNAAGEFHIDIDYTTPAYRDCSVAAYLFSHIGSFCLTKAVVSSPTASHENYLHKIGFNQTADKYTKEL
jgi:hypothetical protein